MATETLEVIITGKDKFSGKLKGIGSTLGTIGTVAAGIATGGVALAAGAVVGLGAGILTLSKDAARLGPITDAFYDLAKASGKSGDVMLDSLRETSNNLIRDTDLMMGYNKATQLVGDEFANRLPDAMEYLGKVSASTGEDMGYMMNSLVTGVGRLSPMIMDNLGIQVDLSSAYETYAASLGKSASELTKAEQQTALMNQAMMMLAENTANLPEMTDPIKQIGVTFMNLKDMLVTEIGPVLLPLIQDLADQLTTFVQSDEFQAWIEQAAQWLKENLVPAIEQLFKWVAEELPPAIAELARFWREDLQPALNNFWAFMNNSVFPAMATLWNWLTKVGEGIGAVVEKISSLIDWVRRASESLSSIALPSWLTPGSPTPLEMGLIGINKAMSNLSQTSLPGISAGFGSMQAAPLAAGGGGATVVINYSPMISMASEQEFQASFLPLLDSAMRRLDRGKVQ